MWLHINPSLVWIVYENVAVYSGALASPQLYYSNLYEWIQLLSFSTNYIASMYFSMTVFLFVGFFAFFCGGWLVSCFCGWEGFILPGRWVWHSSNVCVGLIYFKIDESIIALYRFRFGLKTYITVTYHKYYFFSRRWYI